MTLYQNMLFYSRVIAVLALRLSINKLLSNCWSYARRNANQEYEKACWRDQGNQKVA